MSKYIDADTLKERVTRLIASARQNDWPIAEDYLRRVIDIMDSLQQEQPEVDLEKEYKEFVEDDPVYKKLVNGIVGKHIARHFYELGRNARKEDK